MKIKRLCFFIVLTALPSIWGCALHSAEKVKAKTILPDKFIEFRLAANCKDDQLLQDIKRDLKDKTSILDLMKLYIEALKKDAGPDSMYLKKLRKLFDCGRAKARVEGHFYGLTVILKKGEHPHGGFLNQLWGTTLGDVSPWDGKTFNAIESEQLRFYTDGYETGDDFTFFGINCFKEYEESFLNMTSMAVLSFWMNLKEAPKAEKMKYGYHRKGGLFIAGKNRSVDSENRDKEVFQLNYRWSKLKNPSPLKYLIDEIVEIADGLYLGQLLFATQYLLEDYNPERPLIDYGYENFGYFLLIDDQWDSERMRLFPH